VVVLTPLELRGAGQNQENLERHKINYGGQIEFLHRYCKYKAREVKHLLLPIRGLQTNNQWSLVWIPTDGRAVIEVTWTYGDMTQEERNRFEEIKQIFINISNRWRRGMPGRDLDAVGFRFDRPRVENDNLNDSNNLEVMALIAEQFSSQLAGLERALETRNTFNSIPLEEVRDRLTLAALTNGVRQGLSGRIFRSRVPSRE
jgi:hypothetical protein